MIYVKNKKQILAIIIRKNYKKKGITFFTPKKYSQQLGYMNRPKNYVIKPHVHKEVKREVKNTREVLFIKSGKIKVDFYSNTKKFICSRIVSKGDVLLLVDGGHGFKMLQNSEIFEVKQGPYNGLEDKVVF